MNKEETFITPVYVQFESEVLNGNYHRIGEPDKIFQDAIYRIKTENLNKEEILKLVESHHALKWMQ